MGACASLDTAVAEAEPRSSRRRTSTPRSPSSARCCSRPAPSARSPSPRRGRLLPREPRQDLQRLPRALRARRTGRRDHARRRARGARRARRGRRPRPRPRAGARSSRPAPTPATTRASSARWRPARAHLAPAARSPSSAGTGPASRRAARQGRADRLRALPGAGLERVQPHRGAAEGELREDHARSTRPARRSPASRPATATSTGSPRASSPGT